jgi:hypothetical protein
MDSYSADRATPSRNMGENKRDNSVSKKNNEPDDINRFRGKLTWNTY